MKTSNPVKFASILLFSAFFAGSAFAGPAYPSMFPVKKAPTKEARAAECPMATAKTKVVSTNGPRLGTPHVKVTGQVHAADCAQTCGMSS